MTLELVYIESQNFVYVRSILSENFICKGLSLLLMGWNLHWWGFMIILYGFNAKKTMNTHNYALKNLPKNPTHYTTLLTTHLIFWVEYWIFNTVSTKITLSTSSSFWDVNFLIFGNSDWFWNFIWIRLDFIPSRLIVNRQSCQLQ